MHNGRIKKGKIVMAEKEFHKIILILATTKAVSKGKLSNHQIKDHIVIRW